MAHSPQDPESTAASRRTLVAALHPDSDRFRRCVASSSSRIDWPWVVKRAVTHKVAALLAARTEEVGILPTLNADVQAQLRQIRQEARERVTLAQQTLSRLDAELRRVEVPFFVTKGSVVAAHVYGDPSLRRFVDVDIVVPPAAVGAAAAGLRSMGYRLGQVDAILGSTSKGSLQRSAAEARLLRFFQRYSYELPFDPPSGTDLLAVDLHWHVAPHYRIDAGAEELWLHTVAVQVGGMPTMTLDPTATLIHLAVHAIPIQLSGLRLLHLCDVAWAATRFRGSGSELWELAGAWGAATHLAAVFALIECGLDIQIPAHLRSVGPLDGWRRKWVCAVATQTFLTEDYRKTDDWTWQRRWAELAWNVAMRCLWPHTLLSLRVRRARLQWALFKWRQRRR